MTVATFGRAGRSAMTLADIDIAVLAGGLGTRLAGALGDLPKVLAPVAGRPFLDHMLDRLAEEGAKRVVLCLGYRAERVLAHLDRHPRADLELVASVEPSARGTAGAIAHAYEKLRSDPVMVINGDTFVDADFGAFASHFRASKAPAAILCVRVADPAAGGRLDIDLDDRIVRFREKPTHASETSWISAGVYLFGRAILERIAELRLGSLERDVFEVLPPGTVLAWKTDGRFIDIGTPESLTTAAEVIAAAVPRARPRPALA